MPEMTLQTPFADGTTDQVNPAFWQELITTETAARFVHLTPRKLEAFRQTGGGPRYVRISSRCIRYRRADLRQWAEARLASSTSDTSAAA